MLLLYFIESRNVDAVYIIDISILYLFVKASLYQFMSLINHLEHIFKVREHSSLGHG